MLTTFDRGTTDIGVFAMSAADIHFVTFRTDINSEIRINGYSSAAFVADAIGSFDGLLQCDLSRPGLEGDSDDLLDIDGHGFVPFTRERAAAMHLGESLPVYIVVDGAARFWMDCTRVGGVENVTLRA